MVKQMVFSADSGGNLRTQCAHGTVHTYLGSLLFHSSIIDLAGSAMGTCALRKLLHFHLPAYLSSCGTSHIP